MARAQKYLKQDGRTQNWVYRRQFPRDIGEIDGTKTFVRSLGTSDLAQANRQWSTHDAEFEAKVKHARSLAVYRSSKDARREKFWLSVARWIVYERARSGGELHIFSEMTVPTIVAPASHTFVILRNMFLAWARANDPDAAAVFSMGDVRLDSLFENGLIGAYFVALESQKIDAGKKAGLPAGTGTSLREVLERFKAEKNRSAATFKDMERAIDAFASACGGDSPTVEATTKEHMSRFRSYLVKRDQLKGRTRNKIRANLSSLFSHAQTLFLIDRNPVELVATFEQDDSEKRKPFSDADLKAIFSPARFSPEIGVVRYWIPLLSLYTAARQGELGQLDRTDVFEDPDSGLWVLAISDEGAGQSAKTEDSIRTIPVPQTIIDLGFEQFVQSVKSGPLFGTRRSPNGAFPNLSTDLNAMIRAAGIGDPQKVFHSFRHTTRTKARSFEIPEETMDFIAGHASVNVGRRYGTHEVHSLKRYIDMIGYPLSLPKWKVD